MCPPVLFLIFNRPDLIERSFAQIREAKPEQLFIAADGPRMDRPDEYEACRRSRMITEQVDWDCEVKTLFREENLGCRVAVSSAITWFFEHVEEGIILEDDCVADPSFFGFCGELLDYYRDDERVMCVTGNNFQDGQKRGDAHYYFSIYNHCWGWATWRRAWKLYDQSMIAWPKLEQTGFCEGFLRSHVAEYWNKMFNAVANHEIDSWGFVWTFTCWSNSGLTAVPCVNLVKNIGFDERATHTTYTSSRNGDLPTASITFPLTHALEVCRHPRADQWTEDHAFDIAAPSQITLVRRVKSCLKQFLKMVFNRSSRRLD